MPKYWGKQIFSLWRFPEVCQKPKTEREKKRKREERLNDGNNNGQLRIANATSAKLPGPKRYIWIMVSHFGTQGTHFITNEVIMSQSYTALKSINLFFESCCILSAD